MSYSLPAANMSYDIIHCLCRDCIDGIKFWMSSCVSYENKQTYLTGHGVSLNLMLPYVFICFYSQILVKFALLKFSHGSEMI